MRTRAQLLAHIVNTGSQYNTQEAFGRIRRRNHREVLSERFENPDVRKSIAADIEILNAYDSVAGSMECEIQITTKNPSGFRNGFHSFTPFSNPIL